MADLKDYDLDELLDDVGDSALLQYVLDRIPSWEIIGDLDDGDLRDWASSQEIGDIFSDRDVMEYVAESWYPDEVHNDDALVIWARERGYVYKGDEIEMLEQVLGNSWEAYLTMTAVVRGQED